MNYGNTTDPTGRVLALALHTRTAASELTPELLARAERRGREERAKAAAAAARALGRAVAGTVRALAGAARALGAGLARYQRRRAAHAVLVQLDGHLLADLGLRRDQVRAGVEAMLSQPEERRAAAPAADRARDSGAPRVLARAA